MLVDSHCHLDFPDFAGWLAAALLDRPFFEAQDVLEELADAHLVEIDGIGRACTRATGCTT